MIEALMDVMLFRGIPETIRSDRVDVTLVRDQRTRGDVFVGSASP
jgi:hypothetical protein